MKDKQRYTQWLDLLILSLPNCQHELNPQLYATWKDNQRLGVQAMHADQKRTIGQADIGNPSRRPSLACLSETARYLEGQSAIGRPSLPC